VIVTFNGYRSPLKTLWLSGRLKSVTKGLYGDVLTKETLSLEHLIPTSKGGKTELGNLVLASADKNAKRGCKPLKDCVTKEQAEAYIKQFEGIKYMQIYINAITDTFKKLGVL